MGTWLADHWQQATAILLVVLGLLLMLVLSWKIPDPTDAQKGVWNFVLAVIAAVVGALVPGFFNIEGTVANLTIRAGGAIGLFVLVHLLKPIG